VDAVTDLATPLPLSVVPDLVGWPNDRRQHLLRWGGATFDVLGPLNRYALKSVPACRCCASPRTSCATGP